MIEVLGKNDQIIGYINGIQYLNAKKNLEGFLDGNIVKHKNGEILLKIDDRGDIFYDWDEKVGYLKDGKIYFHNGDLIYKYSKDTAQIYDSQGKVVIHLKGYIDEIRDIDFFGIATIFLELFS